jgi:hypothetical protein
VGDPFNPAGMVISVAWSDGTNTTVTVPANGTLPQGVTVSGLVVNDK